MFQKGFRAEWHFKDDVRPALRSTFNIRRSVVADQDERDSSYVSLFTDAHAEHISTHFGQVEVGHHQIHVFLAVDLKGLDSGSRQQDLEIFPVEQALSFIKKVARGVD